MRATVYNAVGGDTRPVGILVRWIAWPSRCTYMPIAMRIAISQPSASSASSRLVARHISISPSYPASCVSAGGALINVETTHVVVRVGAGRLAGLRSCLKSEIVATAKPASLKDAKSAQHAQAVQLSRSAGYRRRAVSAPDRHGLAPWHCNTVMLQQLSSELCCGACSLLAAH